MKRKLVIASLLFGALLLTGLWLFSSVSLSAVEDPGRLETWIATKAKRHLVSRAAAHVSPRPLRDDAAVAMGGMQFRADCAACHGSDGRTPTEIGKGMSPRAPDLGTADVQAWSDAELFWIIQNGIKMTGMPGFRRTHVDERIWHLVHYVREIGVQAGAAKAAQP